jgi:hypothetical protein
MRWVPLYFRSTFSMHVPDAARDTVIARAEAIILHRGQVLSERSPEHLVFKPSWSQFFFYHPYLFVTRTNVAFKNGRLIYTLSHPLVPLLVLVVLMVTSSRNGSGLLAISFLIISYFHHSVFLFFVHREILRKILNGPTGLSRLAKARAFYKKH